MINKNLRSRRFFQKSDREFQQEICQDQKDQLQNIKISFNQMKQPVLFEVDESFHDLSYTYSFGKYSCISWMYPLHIIFAYLVVLMGFLAILSRVVDKLRPYHVAFGRWYLIFMFWCMSSSLVIHNNGLPLPILVTFLYLLVSITIGWNVIRIHINSMAEMVNQRVNTKINDLLSRSTGKQINIQKMEKEETMQILQAKTFKERFFSYRMLHGILMTFSWCQMLGRTLVTNPFTTFEGCWTYPAYKSMDSTVYAVDYQSTPGFPMETGVFLTVVTVPTVLIIFAVAIGTTYCFYRLQRTKVMEVSQVSPPNSETLNN